MLARMKTPALLAAALGAALLASSLTARPQMRDVATWPPAPRQMVTLTGKPVVVGPIGASVAVYTVPTDQWFVLVQTRSTSGIAPSIEVVEELMGTETVKLQFMETVGNSASEAAVSGLGAAFQPGSVVKLRVHQTIPFNGIMPYTIYGYLVPL